MKKVLQRRGTALITGGAKRIGEALCLELAEQGYHIALHYHASQKEAHHLATRIRKKNVSCQIYASDLTKEKNFLQLIQKIHKASPDLNLLVNNASVFRQANFLEETLNNFDQHFSIHLKTPFFLSQQFAKICRRGHIINILDTSIVRYKTDYFAYLLSKKSLLDLTKMAAVALAPHIRVNGIAPGSILPPTGQHKKYPLGQNTPLKYPGSLLHIQQALRFLLTDNYVTGQIIFVDGGRNLNF